jgi:hypothetical protein
MHLMIDLETLSTAGDAAIAQIGLAPFWIDGEGLAAEGLQINVDPQSCIDLGFRIDWSTLHWWMMQEQDAREALPLPGKGVPIGEALVQVGDYIRKLQTMEGGGRIYVWSNGATFDIPILGHAFRLLGMKEPWGYQDARDTRTLSMLALNAIKPKAVVKHRALDDAVAQVLWVQNMWREAWPNRVSTGPLPGGSGEVMVQG